MVAHADALVDHGAVVVPADHARIAQRAVRAQGRPRYLARFAEARFVDMRLVKQVLFRLFRAFELQLLLRVQTVSLRVYEARILARCEPHHQNESCGQDRLHVAQVGIGLLAEDKQDAEAQH